MRTRFGIKKQLVIYISLVFFILVLCIGGIMIPAVLVIIDTGKRIQISRQEVERQYGKSQLLRRSIREIESSRTFAKVATAATVPDNSELTIITAFEKMSDAHGIEETLHIEKKNLSDSTSTSTRPFIQSGLKNYYEVRLSSQGSFPELLSYLHDIEHLPFYVLIDGVNFDTPPAKETTPKPAKVTLQFTGRIFITP